MNEDLISVVIPVYNVEKYLKNCVNSVINQNYKNLEIILVDDGSLDNSPIICENLKKIDNRINVIHKKNGGLSVARNAGINVAKGKYITFIDSDDFVFPHMIQDLYNLCVMYQADFSMCQLIRCKEEDTLENIKIKQIKEEIKIFEGQNKMEAYLKNDEIDTTTWKKLYSIDLFKSMRFPKNKLHEDAFTTYKLVDEAKKIVITNKIGYVYRFNSNSIMNTKFTVKNLDIITAKTEQLKLIQSKYPWLLKYGYSELIYACNMCLMKMTIAKFYDNEIEHYIQNLYREYTKYYLTTKKVSFNGKLLAINAYFDTKIARIIISKLHRK